MEMEIAKLVLEYLKVLSSPQMIAGIVILGFFILFRGSIRSFIENIKAINLPNIEITSQAGKTKEETLEPKKAPDIPTEYTPAIPQDLSLTPKQIEQIGHLLKVERANAYLWEYKYLNHFLVRHTQEVLDWLASLTTPITYSFYDNFWQENIPSSIERQAIINALQQHHLIQFTTHNELIDVSPKGKEYIEWRGTLPPISN